MSISISNRRELFVDSFILNTEKTTAREVMHRPVKRECVMTNDAPWEANGWVYYRVLRDGDLFRMYYICFPMYNREHTEHKPYFYHACYAESRDGIVWTKPSLGICEIDGSSENNVISIQHSMDAFHVFIDENPKCPENEKYKAVYTQGGANGLELWYRTSSDGIHFGDGRKITDKGAFDSYNSLFWDNNIGKYVCYARDFHRDSSGARVRDVRRMESDDMQAWSEPELISYTDSPYDFQMYTNGVQQYFRAPHIYVAFPTRYNERKSWSKNYDRLCGAEHRKFRMTVGDKRYGLALTDGLFMSSRDGKSFRRRNEAFLRPGAESPMRWVYGDGYLAYGMLDTETGVPGEDKELSFYACANAWSEERIQIFRYTLRADGFVSRSADYEGATLVTKPFTFDGNELSVNFSTSSAGFIRIVLEDEDGNAIEGFDSGELFGDSTDRIVDFDKSVAELCGKTIVMRIEMCDADIYSFAFLKN